MTYEVTRPDPISVAVRGLRLWLWCPGCDDLHAVDDKWQWDWPDQDDTDRVTISPSILVTMWSQHLGRDIKRCHSFVRDGQWEFLGDCSHSLAGQTVDLVPLPDWFFRQDGD